MGRVDRACVILLSVAVVGLQPGLASGQTLISGSVKTWRALHKAVAKRDIEQVVAMAARRIDDTRDAAIRALDAPNAAGIKPTSAAAAGPAPRGKRSRPASATQA